MKLIKSKTKTANKRWLMIAIIIICISFLAWDVSRNGFSAAWGALPAGQVAPDPEPVVEAITPQINEEAQESEDSAAHFATMRLEREQARGEEIAMLERIITDPQTSPAVLEDAEKRRLAIASDIENEIMAESLLNTKGYGETVVMISSTGATVIIDVEIEAKDAAIIAEIVDRASNCGYENVVIVNR